MVGVVGRRVGLRTVALAAALGLGALAAVVPTASAHAAPAASRVAPAAAPAGGVYVPVTPTRVEDTRSGPGVMGRLAGGGSVTVAVPTGVVPAGSSAVAVNVTAADPSSVGNLAAYPGGTTEPQTSTVNFDSGRDVANAAIVSLSSANTLTVTDNSSGGVDVVVDVDGYFTTSGAASGGAGHYYPLTPARVTDTRSTSMQPNAGKTLAAGSTLNVQVGGQGGVPSSGVEAVVANLTATDVSAGADFLTAFAAGAAQPGVSNLNVGAGDTRANRVIIPVSASGAISVFNNAGTADVIVDVDGYVSDQTGSAGGGNLFTPTAPTRVLDTRNPGGTPFSAAPTVTTLAGQAGLPAAGAGGATAVAMNVTEANSSGVTTGSTYLTTYPAGTTAPLASDLNYPAGDTRPNLDIATLSAQGQIAGLVGSGTANVIYDITGYFTPASASSGPYSVTLSPTSGPPGTVVTGTITQTSGSSGSTSARPALSGVSQVTVNGCGLTNQTEPVSASGTFTFTIPSNAPSGNCAISVTINGQTTTPPGGYIVGPATALAVTTTSLPAGTVGVAYPQTVLAASGGTSPYTWAATGLPAGLNLSTSGVLSGTPTTAGTSNVAITATDSKGATANATLSLTVNPASAAPHETDYPPYLSYGDAVSCPSASTCYVVGETFGQRSVVLTTTNGGQTWSDEPIPPDVALDAISCPTTTNCTVVGSTYTGPSDNGAGYAISTSDGGGAWTVQALPSGLGDLTGVSCPSTTVCIGVGSSEQSDGSYDGAVVGTTNGGGVWSQQTVPSGTGYLAAVSCSTVSVCTAVGSASEDNSGTASTSIISTTNGGASWSAQSAPPSYADLAAVSCSSTSICTAVGSGEDASSEYTTLVLGTTNGGASWENETIPTGLVDLSGLSCPSTTTCTAVGVGSSEMSAIISTTNGGTGWVMQPPPNGSASLSAISCSTGTICIAAGTGAANGASEAVIGTENGGTSWSAQPIPMGLSGLDSVSCASTTSCIAIGSDAAGNGIAISTTNGGTSWRSQTLPSGAGDLSSISCPSLSACIAVGGSTILATTNGGGSWGTQLVPSDVLSLSDVSCPTTSTCEAVGQNQSAGGEAIATTNGGATWVSQSVPVASGYLSDVACPSTTICTAVGASIESVPGNYAVSAVAITTMNGGATWTGDTLPADVSSASLSGISCPTGAACTVVGGEYRNDGVPEGVVILNTTNGGQSWVEQSAPTDVGVLSGVSCTSVAQCVAAGESTGPAAAVISTTNGGSTWADQTVPSDSESFASVSCPATGTCAVTGTTDVGGAVADVFPS